MKKITRKTFLKQSLGIGSLLVVNPLMANNAFISFQENALFKRVVAANTKAVDALVKDAAVEIAELKRDLGYDFANLASAYSEPSSKYFQQAQVIPMMERIMRYLLKAQRPDGTLNLGNFESPPDTAFILEPICAAIEILNKDKASKLDETKSIAKQFILKAGDALTVGGIHTPNHRWVVSAALAQINSLYPNQKYVNRINEWFSENLFMDIEGHYLERSMIYSEVIDRALLVISRHLNKPELLKFVRKNLDMVYFYIEPNGDVVTTDSRRQDQFKFLNALPFYMSYRYLSILDKNKDYAAVAELLENIKDFDEKVLNQALFWFFEEPLLKNDLPKANPMNSQFEQFFKETNLVRFRRGNRTATLFGGNDFPLVISSGRSTSPNFFAFRKGEAILQYMRLSSEFFSTGYFRSHGIQKVGDSYVLQQKIEVPYYQPLPNDKKRADGDYKHSPSVDGRFWNKMDFDNRPLSNVKVLNSKITITEKNGSFDLTFDIEGTEDVYVTIELCFNKIGTLSPMKTYDNQPDNFFLNKGIGTYQVGQDTLTFGHGTFSHSRVGGIDGEVYTSHFGTMRTEGKHVFLTGKTPFKHLLTIS